MFNVQCSMVNVQWSMKKIMHAELQLDNQICFRLYTAARLITQAYTPMLTELGITYPQYLVLMVLWEKDCQPVNDIAHRLTLETNTVTPLLQRMEKLGIVTRKKGEQDKRQQIVSLTEKGREMEEQAYKLIPAGMGETLKACPLQMDDYTHLARVAYHSTFCPSPRCCCLSVQQQRACFGLCSSEWQRPASMEV